MQRMVLKQWLFLFLALVTVVPALAAVAKEFKLPVKATIEVVSPATIAGKELKPGSYRVVAEESKITLSQNGKVVAEAPVQWAEANDKEPETDIVLEGNAIKEIRFGGKTRYVVIQP